MELIEWPNETNSDMKINITADKVNEVVQASNENYENFNNWLSQLEDRVSKIEKKKDKK